jgi:hypothetical protein
MCGAAVEDRDVGQVVGQQVDIHRQGEGGRVMPKPRLNLLGVKALSEQHRGAGVP